MTGKEILNLYLIFLLSILISFTAFSFVLFLKNKIFINKNNKNIHLLVILDIFFGAAIGSLSFLFFYFSEYLLIDQTHNPINVIIFFLTFFPIYFFISKYASFGFTCLCLISWAINLGIFNSDEMYLILFFIFILNISTFTFNFIYKKNKKIIKYFAIFFSNLIFLFLIIIFENTRHSLYYYLFVFHIFVFSYFTLFFLFFSYKFFTRLYNLTDTILFEEKYFINASYSKEIFYDFIKKTKTENGIFLVLKWHEEFKKNNFETIDLIKNNFEKFQHIFLKTSKNQHVIFIKYHDLTKTTNSILSKIRQINDTLKDSEPHLFMLASIYGIDSNDFDELALNCLNITAENKSEEIIFFNYSKNFTKYFDKYETFNLDKDLNFKNVEINFFKIKNENNIIFIPDIKWISNLNQASLKNKFRNSYSLIERFCSTKILDTFFYMSSSNKNLLLLPYPLSEIEKSDFNPNDLIIKITNNFGTDILNRIILTISDEQKIKSFSNLKNSLFFLKDSQIKIGFFHKEQFIQSKLKEIEFDFYFYLEKQNYVNIKRNV